MGFDQHIREVDQRKRKVNRHQCTGSPKSWGMEPTKNADGGVYRGPRKKMIAMFDNYCFGPKIKICLTMVSRNIG